MIATQNQYKLSTEKHNKIAHTVFANQSDQIQLPWVFNASYDLISPLTFPLFNINGSRSNNSIHIFKCVQNHDP